MEDSLEYGIDNHFEVRSWNPLRAKYAYVDTAKHLADIVFAKHALQVRFGRADMVFVDMGYRIVFCSVRKRDRKKFLESMADLERKMLLRGHEDYPDVCRKIFAPLSQS